MMRLSVQKQKIGHIGELKLACWLLKLWQNNGVKKKEGIDESITFMVLQAYQTTEIIQGREEASPAIRCSVLWHTKKKVRGYNGN